MKKRNYLKHWYWLYVKVAEEIQWFTFTVIAKLKSYVLYALRKVEIGGIKMTMTVAEKRLKRIESKRIIQARIQMLAEIEKLDVYRCKSCAFVEGESSFVKSKCGCPAAVKIRKCGSLLDKLLTERKVEGMETLETLTFEDLTPAIYNELKAKKIADREIRKILKIGTNKFTNWKDANGVSRAMKGESVC